MTTTPASAIPFNIKDPYWSQVHPGMPCRIKHRLILVRHGESESNIELTTTGKTTEFSVDPGLTALGREQAQDVADFLEYKGIKYDDHVDKIHISPLWRAIQTALPTLNKSPYCDIKHSQPDPFDDYESFEPPEFNLYNEQFCVDINYELREKYSKEPYWVSMCDISEYATYLIRKNFDLDHTCVQDEKKTTWLRQPETHLEFCERVASVMNDWKMKGSIEDRKQTIVFTHSQFISQLLSGDSKMSFHLANGSISIIDIDEKNDLHVQVANYTKHLRTPTGMHTCIF
jgi:broad specificity phosphatase PhoE